MFNNFHNLFQKYTNKLLIQKDLEDRILILLKEISGLSLQKLNIKINQKNKIIEILNLTSSKRFFVIQKIKETKIDEKIKNDFGFIFKI